MVERNVDVTGIALSLCSLDPEQSTNMATGRKCLFFVEKKKRRCKMETGKDKLYCGEHGFMEQGSRRIICPLDPNHTVCEDKLHTHLMKCNSREKPRPVYYVENINAGAAEETTELPKVSLCERSRAELDVLIQKLKRVAEGLCLDVGEHILSHSALHEELNDPKNGDSAHKHLRQQASILGHMQQLGLLGDGRSFVEFGAGRGKLSHWIHRALQDQQNQQNQQNQQEVRLLLVERSATRFKVDGKHQEGGVAFHRLQMDIQHLDLSKVPLLTDKRLPLVGVGKHLCGAATDLALRCLLDTWRVEQKCEPSDDTSPDPGSGPGPVLGLVVALCCHHRCEWRHFVGRDFFLMNGLGASEFEAFTRMSSWATCGLSANQNTGGEEHEGAANQSTGGEEHEAAAANQNTQEEEQEAAGQTHSLLSPEERLLIGQLCKRVIDGGRCHFLQTKGFHSKMTRFVHADVTLENVLLTAVQSPAPSS